MQPIEIFKVISRNEPFPFHYGEIISLMLDC